MDNDVFDHREKGESPSGEELPAHQGVEERAILLDSQISRYSACKWEPQLGI